MGISYKTVFTFVALVVLLALPYQNCSSYNDPSPFDLPATASAIQSSSSDIRLDSPSGVIDVAATDLTLSLGGECNVGLSTKHFIEIKLSDANNTPISVREPAQCPSGACFLAQEFRCEHGRYYIHLPLSCGQAYRGQTQSLYRLTGQLVVLDGTGKELRDNKALFDRFFQIAWAPGACQ